MLIKKFRIQPFKMYTKEIIIKGRKQDLLNIIIQTLDSSMIKNGEKKIKKPLYS